MLFHWDCNQGKAGQPPCPSGLMLLPKEKETNLESLIGHANAPGSVKSRNTYVCHTMIHKLLTLQCHSKSHNASLCHATILGVNILATVYKPTSGKKF